MKDPKPHKKGPDMKVYGLIAVAVVFVLGYALYPSASGSQGSESAELLKVLLQENERLRGAQAALPIAAAAAVSGTILQLSCCC